MRDFGATTNLRRAILASDFSPGSRNALRRTQYLPFARAAEIVLTHVLPAGDQQPKVTDTAMACIEREREVLCAGLRRNGRSDVAVRTDIFSGTPPVEVVKLAHERTADLVVCGRHGAGKLRGLLLGTTAERIAHLASVSVLVVGPPPAGPFAMPVVALTGDEHARFVLEAALRIIPTRTRIDVISAVSVAMEGWLWGGGGMGSEEILRLREVIRDKAQRELGAILAPYREREPRIRVTLRDGDARKVILASAARKKADVIAVGTHAHKGVVHFHLGSVSAAVVRQALSDVLLVRAPDVTILADSSAGDLREVHPPRAHGR